jgi:hypothetical protein
VAITHLCSALNALSNGVLWLADAVAK